MKGEPQGVSGGTVEEGWEEGTEGWGLAKPLGAVEGVLWWA